MAKKLWGMGVLAAALVLVLPLLGCSTDAADDGAGKEIIGFYCSGGVDGVYGGMTERRDPNSGRSAMASSRFAGLDGIRTDYKYAKVSKYIDGYDAYPDHNPKVDRDWTGVEEGFVKLDYHGLNGDGIALWGFITKQEGEDYVIFAFNDDSYVGQDAGVWPDLADGRNPEGQAYFYIW